MLTLEQVRRELADRRIHAVARGAGLAYDTVWRVYAAKDKRVSYETVKALSDYLEREKA